MRIRALTVTVLAALAALAPSPAQAWPPDDGTYEGGCFLAAVADGTQVLVPPTRWRGVLGAEVVAWAPTIGHNPVHAYVTCDLRVDGVVVATAYEPFSGPVVAYASPVMFTAAETAEVEVCEDVRTWDAHGQVKDSYTCHPATRGEVPLAEVLAPLCAEDDTLCAVAESASVRWLTRFPGL